MEKVKMLKIDEVAECLNISISTVRRLIAKNELKAVKVGGSLRVQESDLKKYVEEKRG